MNLYDEKRKTDNTLYSTHLDDFSNPRFRHYLFTLGLGFLGLRWRPVIDSVFLLCLFCLGQGVKLTPHQLLIYTFLAVLLNIYIFSCTINDRII